MNVITLIQQIIFPEKCVGCGVKGFLVCPSCVSKFTPASPPEHSYCMSVFGYSNPSIRRLIHLLKYKNGRRVARFFAPYVTQAITEFLGEERYFIGSSKVLFVPVPLTKKRMRLRGYNQSELLIKEILKFSNNNKLCLGSNLVVKIKDTNPQAENKKRSVRIQSQIGCFEVVPNSIDKNSIIIIIDDVTTTGATIHEIYNILRDDGFKKIYAFTIAH